MKWIFLTFIFLAACAQTPQKRSIQHTLTPPVDVYYSPIESRAVNDDQPLANIAFGSCFNQDQEAPIWKTISQSNPELFIFLGDNVYASHSSQKPIADQYRKLDQVEGYRALRENIPFMATWDDHDYGLRDGGVDWSGKEMARRDFLNYWTYLRDIIPPEQGGIYHSKTIGPKQQMVQIIMLDTRFYRSPLKERPGNEGKAYDYEPDTTGTVLGEEQWLWLERQLTQPAQVRLIISSIQLIANDPKFEKWDNFPQERKRFFDLLAKTGAKNVIVLSGDRHSASISKVDLPSYGPLYEVTSSAINRPNNFADKDSHYIGDAYTKENFGVAQIDWKKKVVKLEIRDIQNNPVNAIELKIK